jgi:hypothetical protein
MRISRQIFFMPKYIDFAGYGNKKPDQIDRVNAVRKKGLEPPRREGIVLLI